MSKIYKVNMQIDISKVTPNSGILMMQVDKEVDPRGFRERNGAEVFALICEAAINNANPKVSHQQLKAFRKVITDLQNASKNGEFVGNRTDLDIIKNSIEGNRNWPNNEETLGILDQVIESIAGAKIIDENPTPDSERSNTEQKE